MTANSSLKECASDAHSETSEEFDAHFVELGADPRLDNNSVPIDCCCCFGFTRIFDFCAKEYISYRTKQKV
jgi:hypothetical protein